ncbi:MAG: PEGA domain-containing protein [Mesotoga sp.]|uniref:PEGA domain-containing protein n=1 Tax=Mesotoga sp. TaxID=2053577 RepID=UPI0016A14772|nr:PEGA domain-containing protein [Mesotoga sp.]MDI9367377.1 PEGA domain-containing protein [Thermotogota bacterium]NLT44220.1 PEGA domain-containing protein [Thermotogaceae bacterium]MDD3681016.1 PEGA domain-containing protein [Mesotoga sp.]MDD4206698.1 PEGA domain-containing protein [Mesotoga sp.]MDD4826241.1 PEGA domain-containing protein [Mesotoga sp.]
MKKTILVILFFFLAISVFGVVTYDVQKVIIVPEQPQGGLEVSIWLDRDNGSLYYSGEEVKTYFKVNKDAYVAIYDITPNGEIQLIFPNGYDRNNALKAGVTYSLPTDNATTRYRLQLTSETGGGKEIFQIVASTSPLGFLDDLMVRAESGDIFPRASIGAEDFVTMKVIPVIDKQEYAVSTAWFYLDIMPSTGRARITTTPSNATLYVDGKMVGRSPVNIDLDPGNHMVTAYMNGYRTETRQFTIESGRTLDVKLDLQKFAKEYQLSLVTNPSDAVVYINGSSIGRTPLNVTLEEGTKNLSVSKAGYETYTETFVLNRNISKSLTLTPVVQSHQLSVITSPSGADVYVNNAYVGRSPLNVTLEGGTKNLRIERSGYETYSETFVLDRSISKSITLSPQVRDYKLNVTSSPSNALVYINGTYQGRTPLNLTLREGSYTVRVTADGYEDFSTSVSLDRDRQVSATLYAKKARLTVETEPTNASVFVDNVYVGRSPLSIDIDAGRHTIRVEKSGYITDSKDVNLAAGTSSSTKITLIEERPIARITISSDPRNARIFINGRDYGRSNTVVELDPGYYEVVLVLDGYRVSVTYRYFGKGDHNLSFNLSKID